MRSIINNEAADCSISLKFGTEFDHIHPMYYGLSRSMGQRSRSQRYNVSAVKHYKTGTDRFTTEFKR